MKEKLEKKEKKKKTSFTTAREDIKAVKGRYELISSFLSLRKKTLILVMYSIDCLFLDSRSYERKKTKISLLTRPFFCLWLQMDLVGSTITDLTPWKRPLTVLKSYQYTCGGNTAEAKMRTNRIAVGEIWQSGNPSLFEISKRWTRRLAGLKGCKTRANDLSFELCRENEVMA